jgi:hypothetical protein
VGAAAVSFVASAFASACAAGIVSEALAAEPSLDSRAISMRATDSTAAAGASTCAAAEEGESATFSPGGVCTAEFDAAAAAAAAGRSFTCSFSW